MNPPEHFSSLKPRITEVSVFSDIGGRQEQQDVLLATQTADKQPVFGIFDGHLQEGNRSAVCVKNAVKKAVESFRSLEGEHSIAQNIADTLVQESARQKERRIHGGSTATIVSIPTIDTLQITQLGDSAAVYFPAATNSTAILLHTTHDTSNPVETGRVLSDPSCIDSDKDYFYANRTTQSSTEKIGLALTRSVGDFLYPFVLDEPEIITPKTPLSRYGRGVLVIASDGLWGTRGENVTHVESTIRQRSVRKKARHPNENFSLAQELVENGLRYTNDNISAIAIKIGRATLGRPQEAAQLIAQATNQYEKYRNATRVLP